MEKELPNGWVETNLGAILKLKNGYAFKSEDFKDSGVPVIRISNIQNELVQIEEAAKIDLSKIKQEFIVRKGDILIAMSGATTGKYGIYNEEDVALQNQRVGNLVPYDESLTSRKFILYLLGRLKREIEEKAYGGAQPNISPKLIEEIKIWLPPIPEQQRIVVKLDTLFGQLDQIKASMERIPQLLKDFRQKLLTQAVTGKLTEEWREGRELEEWKQSSIGRLFEVKTGATPNRGVSKYYENANIPWIKSGLVKNEFIYEADEFISEVALLETNTKVFPKDTLLVAMYGEGKTRGQVGWLKIGAATNQAIAALVNETMPHITRTYVFFYCLSQYNEIRSKAEGGNQPNLNLSKIKDWEINIPPVVEQQEIVRRVESLFAKADRVETSYRKLKAKLEKLPQALLTKAFRGELVGQLPSDGDARDLLEQIKKPKAK